MVLLFSCQGMLKPTLDEIFRHWLLLVLEDKQCRIQNVRRGWGATRSRSLDYGVWMCFPIVATRETVPTGIAKSPEGIGPSERNECAYKVVLPTSRSHGLP